MQPLFQHQREALARMAGRAAFGLFMEQGTGKTRLALADAQCLHDHERIHRLLVLAPNGVHAAWREQAEQWLGAVARVHIWRGGTTKRERQALDELLTFDGLAILAMNIEAVRTKKGENYAARFLRSRPSMMVVDESTRIKSISAKQTKAAMRLGKLAAYRRILTGTPATESPLDLYAQCAFLDPDLLGFRSFYAFRNRYAVVRQRCFPGRRPFHEVVGYQRLDELQECLARFSYRVTKDECLDLPSKIYQRLPVELSPAQRRAYDTIRRDVLAELDNGRITTPLAITRLLRLQQVVGGHVHYDDGRYEPLDPPERNPRLRALYEQVELAAGKVIVWARFRPELELIERTLRGFGAVSYHGGVSAADREAAVHRFQNDPARRVFIGQPRSGGLGLTLTAANTVIYYSNDFSLETRLQSEDRAHRIGTTRRVVYVDMVAPGTVDERVVKALREKRDLAAMLTGDALREWI